ncbi:hypothetical protein Ocin01_10500, partial [Orchesella cincta]
MILHQSSKTPQQILAVADKVNSVCVLDFFWHPLHQVFGEVLTDLNMCLKISTTPFVAVIYIGIYVTMLIRD